MDWKTLLACITGSVEEQLLLRNAYVVEENRILRNQIAGRVQLTDAERQTLAEIGKKLGKHALEEVATIVKPDTILAWHRKLVAQQFDGSEQRKSMGRPRVDQELEDLVVQMAKENRSWGYDRIAGALTALGYDISDQTVGNILKRRGLPSAPDRQKTTTWKEFIRIHMEVLWATDFFSTEVWTLGGLVTFYVLFFIKLDTREVRLAGVTAHPNEQWMMQVARNATMEEWGSLNPVSISSTTGIPSTVMALRQEAIRALETRDFAQVETLLRQAHERDLHAIQEQQASLHTRQLSAAATSAELGALKNIQLSYVGSCLSSLRLIPAT